MQKLLLHHKMGLIIFGFFLFLILLEGGLRMGGIIITAVKEHKNRISLSKKADYTILCLGESTTDDQWPPYLAMVLNESDTGITFKIVDKGRGATDTAAILSKLEHYLDEYNPNMVITMMGINDGHGTVKYEDNFRVKTILFLQEFRIYKLTKLLWEHIIHKVTFNKDAYAFFDTKETMQKKNVIDKDNKMQIVIQKMSEHNHPISHQRSDELHYSGKEYIEFGQEYERGGQYKEAEEMYKKSMCANPKGLYAYLDLGLLYVKQEQYKAAEEILIKGIEVDPCDAEGYLRLAECYQKQRKYKSAEKMFHRSIALDSDHSYNYVLFAECLTEQGKFDEAVTILKKAKEKTHDDERIYIKLSWVYIKQQKYDKAEEIFKEAAALFDKKIHANQGMSILIYCDLASTYIWQRKYGEAEDILNKIIKIDPRNNIGYARLGWCYREQGRYTLAEEMLMKSIEMNPGESFSYMHLAQCYIEQKYYDKAIATLLKVKDSDAHAPRLLELCYQLVKYEKLFQDNPDEMNIFLQLVHLYKEVENFAELERLVLQALESYAGHHQGEYCDMLNLLGLYYLDAGKYNDAEKIYKRALQINPNNSVLYTGLALSYYRRGQYEDVAVTFEKAIEMYPTESAFYEGLGLCYFAQKKYHLARMYFRKARELSLMYYNPATYYNYNALKEIVQSRGIQLVCVQYPMMNCAPLKKLLQPHDSIIFVDNENIFKEAVRKESYSEYFTDSFAGCFGHCTGKGNRLLAKNIADTILRKCFND